MDILYPNFANFSSTGLPVVGAFTSTNIPAFHVRSFVGQLTFDAGQDDYFVASSPAPENFFDLLGSQGSAGNFPALFLPAPPVYRMLSSNGCAPEGGVPVLGGGRPGAPGGKGDGPKSGGNAPDWFHMLYPKMAKSLGVATPLDGVSDVGIYDMMREKMQDALEGALRAEVLRLSSAAGDHGNAFRVLEASCHGGSVAVSREISRLLVELGCREDITGVAVRKMLAESSYADLRSRLFNIAEAEGVNIWVRRAALGELSKAAMRDHAIRQNLFELAKRDVSSRRDVAIAANGTKYRQAEDHGGFALVRMRLYELELASADPTGHLSRKFLVEDGRDVGGDCVFVWRQMIRSFFAGDTSLDCKLDMLDALVHFFRSARGDVAMLLAELTLLAGKDREIFENALYAHISTYYDFGKRREVLGRLRGVPINAIVLGRYDGMSFRDQVRGALDSWNGFMRTNRLRMIARHLKGEVPSGGAEAIDAILADIERRDPDAETPVSRELATLLNMLIESSAPANSPLWSACITSWILSRFDPFEAISVEGYQLPLGVRHSAPSLSIVMDVARSWLHRSEPGAIPLPPDQDVEAQLAGERMSSAFGVLADGNSEDLPS